MGVLDFVAADFGLGILFFGSFVLSEVCFGLWGFYFGVSLFWTTWVLVCANSHFGLCGGCSVLWVVCALGLGT